MTRRNNPPGYYLDQRNGFYNHKLRTLIRMYLVDKSGERRSWKKRYGHNSWVKKHTGLLVDTHVIRGIRLRGLDEEIMAAIDVDHLHLFGSLEGLEIPILKVSLRPIISGPLVDKVMRSTRLYELFEGLHRSYKFPSHCRNDIGQMTPDKHSRKTMTRSYFCASFCCDFFPLILGPQNKRCLAFRWLGSLIGRLYLKEWTDMGQHPEFYDEWRQWLLFTLEDAWCECKRTSGKKKGMHIFDKANFRHILEVVGFDMAMFGGTRCTRCMLLEKEHKHGKDKAHNHNNYVWNFEEAFMHHEAVKLAMGFMTKGGKWGVNRRFRCSQRLIDICRDWDKPLFPRSVGDLRIDSSGDEDEIGNDTLGL